MHDQGHLGYGRKTGRPRRVSHKDVVYRSVEEIQREIDALDVQMSRLAPLLRNVSSSDSPEDRRRRSWTSRARS
jgi:hypothetical protein